MANYTKNKKYHYIYKTVNLINGRYYLGMHSTNRLDDGYLGSGKRLYYELSKYGRDNFKFEILKYFNSREKLVQAEIDLITEQDLKNPNCLNIVQGGEGFTIEGSLLANNARKALLEENREWKDKYSAKLSEARSNYIKGLSEEELKQLGVNVKKGQERVKFNHATFKGRKHTEETRQKMKQSKIGHGVGNKNSQYGKPRSEETKQKIRESLQRTREKNAKKS